MYIQDGIVALCLWAWVALVPSEDSWHLPDGAEMRQLPGGALCCPVLWASSSCPLSGKQLLLRGLSEAQVPNPEQLPEWPHLGSSLGPFTQPQGPVWPSPSSSTPARCRVPSFSLPVTSLLHKRSESSPPQAVLFAVRSA